MFNNFVLYLNLRQEIPQCFQPWLQRYSALIYILLSERTGISFCTRPWLNTWRNATNQCSWLMMNTCLDRSNTQGVLLRNILVSLWAHACDDHPELLKHCDGLGLGDMLFVRKGLTMGGEKETNNILLQLWITTVRFILHGHRILQIPALDSHYTIRATTTLALCFLLSCVTRNLSPLLSETNLSVLYISHHAKKYVAIYPLPVSLDVIILQFPMKIAVAGRMLPPAIVRPLL